MYRMLCKALTTAALALVLWMAAPASASATLYGPILYGGDILYCGDMVESPSHNWGMWFGCNQNGEGMSGQYPGVGNHCSASPFYWCWLSASLPSNWAVMQTDGNYVDYWDTTWKFQTYTSGYYGAFLNVQDDANIVVYTAWSSPRWSIW